jgi:hypothetical protein
VILPSGSLNKTDLTSGLRRGLSIIPSFLLSLAFWAVPAGVAGFILAMVIDAIFNRGRGGDVYYSVWVIGVWVIGGMCIGASALLRAIWSARVEEDIERMKRERRVLRPLPSWRRPIWRDPR